jgi:hypothetical protein
MKICWPFEGKKGSRLRSTLGYILPPRKKAIVNKKIWNGNKIGITRKNMS